MPIRLLFQGENALRTYITNALKSIYNESRWIRLSQVMNAICQNSDNDSNNFRQVQGRIDIL